MIDFTDAPKLKKGYGGANGNKISILLNGSRWMLKFPSISERSPAGHQQRRQGALCTSAGQSQHFPAERLCRAGRHDPAVLHLGAGANQTPPQPPECHADLPGAGIQRSDYPPQAGFGQACPHHAELPSRRQTDRQGRSARCADLRPCAVCKPSTYALEITHRLKRQMLWKGGQRWKYF